MYSQLVSHGSKSFVSDYSSPPLLVTRKVSGDEYSGSLAEAAAHEHFIRTTCQGFNIGLGTASRPKARVVASAHARNSTWARFFRGDYSVIPERSTSSRRRRCTSAEMVEIWDIIVVFALFVSAYYVPFALALLSNNAGRLNLAENMLSYGMDLIFTADLFFQFFIAVTNDGQYQATLYEKRPCMIAAHYCSCPFSGGGGVGWFWIDLASIAPVWMPLVLQFLPYDKADGNVIQVCRLIRLCRMLRLLRLKRLLDRWNVEFGISRSGHEFVKFFFLISCTVHWLACTWILVEGRVLVDTGSGHWLPPGQESWLSVLIALKGDSCSPDVDHDVFCIYSIAVYWSTMTLTTVGYGDISPQNKYEYLACCVCMLVSGIVWAYIVGSIISLLTSLDPYGVQHKVTLDSLNELMQAKNLPHALRVRLRRYVMESRDIPKWHGHRTLLEQTVSVGLQREVAAFSLQIMDSVFWTNGLIDSAKNEFIRRLRCEFFGPSEALHLPDKLLILRKGIVAAKGRILGPGDAFGHESILLESELLLDRTVPSTLSYVSLFTLSKEDIHYVRHFFPEAEKKLRKAQIKIALLRYCLLLRDQPAERKFSLSCEFSMQPLHPKHMRKCSSSSLGDTAEAVGEMEVRLTQRQNSLFFDMSKRQDELGTKIDALSLQLKNCRIFRQTL